MDMSLNKLWETVKDKEACSAAVHVVAKSQPPKKRNKAVYIFKYPGEKGNSGAFCVAIPAWKSSILTHFISFFYLTTLGLISNTMSN